MIDSNSFHFLCPACIIFIPREGGVMYRLSYNILVYLIGWIFIVIKIDKDALILFTNFLASSFMDENSPES